LIGYVYKFLILLFGVKLNERVIMDGEWEGTGEGVIIFEDNVTAFASRS
jgi:hypothetical protein